MAIELAVLLILQLLGSSFFSRFEGETPAWLRITKWLVLDGLTIALYFAIGHWALLLLLVLVTIGMTFHFRWCKNHDIHPIQATPRKKYYALRGWKWEE